MGCLSSENLKEREEVLVSTIMVAQRTADSWSTLLTFAGSSEQICFFLGNAEADTFMLV
jgi:hypothetical protein